MWDIDAVGFGPHVLLYAGLHLVSILLAKLLLPMQIALLILSATFVKEQRAFIVAILAQTLFDGGERWFGLFFFGVTATGLLGLFLLLLGGLSSGPLSLLFTGFSDWLDGASSKPDGQSVLVIGIGKEVSLGDHLGSERLGTCGIRVSPPMATCTAD